MTTTAAVAQMLADFLAALGFEAMAKDAATETETDRLQRYARVILKNAPAARREDIRARFVLLRLV